VNPDPEKLQDTLKFISENNSKIKDRRGRHKKYHFETHDWLPKMLGDAKRCDRSKQNYINGRRAFEIIANEAEQPVEVRNAILYYLKGKRTVAAELGRFDHPKALFSAALAMAKSQMPTVKAIGLARRMRGKGSPDYSALAKKIRRTIEAYRDRHPNLSEADITTALRMAAYQ
jgi:hypothetical protein